MKQTFTVKGKLPGMNELIDANRVNPRVGAKLKRDTDAHIGWYAKSQRMQPVSRPVIVHCHWVEPNRRRDPDNVSAAKKFVLDALCSIGVLTGDGFRHIAGFRDSFAFDPTNPRVVVTLEEV